MTMKVIFTIFGDFKGEVQEMMETCWMKSALLPMPSSILFPTPRVLVSYIALQVGNYTKGIDFLWGLGQGRVFPKK